MKTQEVVEGLLYITNHRELTIDCLKACHVLNDTDRNWEPVQHSEFYFLDDFKYCEYLMVIDKLIHVYLIGEKPKGRSYNILQIEGFTCDLLTLSKTELIRYLKEQNKEVQQMYLPEGFGQRIIYLQPDYKNNIVEPFIFNRQSLDEKLFKPGVWTMGVDIYSTNQKEYEIKTDEILKQILGEIE